jgi:2-polyprenyl-3-methyl-5-hydroxy-6-metoxy-1,4-benzoquinol methylase
MTVPRLSGHLRDERLFGLAEHGWWATTLRAVGANEFDEPRIAGIYDLFDSDRSDRGAYAAIVEQLGASRAFDLGCGTGTLAIMLAG